MSVAAAIEKMTEFYKGNLHDVAHFMKVWGFARTIGQLEGLDQQTLRKAVAYISNADVLIIGGTSLTVYPAAGLIDYYNGSKLVLINKSVTPMDSRADLVISGPIGEILGDAVGI